MNPLHPLYAILVFAIAFGAAYLINIKYNFKNTANRSLTIDGLRGFLAMSVFICHSSVWYAFLQTGNWQNPNSNLFTQLGQTSVSFFFMISSYLFVSKLLYNKNNVFDWKSFFIGRFYRLTPLYIFCVILLVVIVLQISNWTFLTQSSDWIKALSKWIFFAYTGQPEINGEKLTPIINAGVVWSLKYEWLLYFCLPLISIPIFRKKPPVVYLVLSIVVVAILCSKTNNILFEHILSFIGGGIAPFVSKCAIKQIDYNSKTISTIVLFCIVFTGFFETSTPFICKLLIIIAFTCIALGNTLFGVLTNNTLHFLGEISYSTYLLHGFILFITFYYIIGFDAIRLFSESEYCYIVMAITPFVIILSFLSFHFIEKPFIAISKKKKKLSLK